VSNPFTPPNARLSDRPPQAGSGLKAVLLGLAVDIGGSTLAGLVLTIAYAIFVAPADATTEQIVASLQSIPEDSWISIAAMVVGGGFSVLGGFVCARVARHSEFALGAVLALLSISFGLWVSAEDTPVMLDVGLSVVTFFAVMFGARLGAARNARG
jgi:hypothetical protein